MFLFFVAVWSQQPYIKPNVYTGREMRQHAAGQRGVRKRASLPAISHGGLS